ncbi:MAG: TPM domain-containing protein [Dysgonamonadaceae bacterium]|jgi:uncharacterized membrane protein|nr:TPM domain-containing protein [Dysgonamonadaceae bacterium]
MLNSKEIKQVKQSISEAEKQTSGEIRVYVARRCEGDPMDIALQKFHSLKMQQTQFRNAVLIFVCPSERKTAIVGDEGIHNQAKPRFWDEALSEMMAHFRRGDIVSGICGGVAVVGGLIKEKYPYSDNDVNELSDEVIVDA